MSQATSKSAQLMWLIFSDVEISYGRREKASAIIESLSLAISEVPELPRSKICSAFAAD